MQHNLFGSNIIVVMLVGVESDENRFFGFGPFYESIFFFRLIGFIEGDVVFTLCSVFVALHIAYHDKFRIFGSVNVVPFFLQKSFWLFLHST